MKKSAIDRTAWMWAFIGFLWALVLAVHLWNLKIIDRIREARERSELVRMDEQFLQSHRQEIERRLAERAALRHETEALSLGLLKVENELRGLADRYGFTAVEVSREPSRGMEDTVPILFAFQGSLRGVMDCLESLRKEYPYLPVARMALKVEPGEKRVRCQVLLNYRYRVVSTGSQT